MGPLPAQTSPTAAAAAAAAATGTTTAVSSSFTPYLPPPPGLSSDREHPESLEQLADVAIGICLPLITIFFFARCYVRAFLKRTWIFEDYLVTVVWAGAVAYCGIMRATMSHNGGRHAWDITASEAHEALYWFNVAAIEYGVMIGLAKISVLVFYRRVFSPIRWSWFDITIVGLIALMAGFYTSITIAKIFECDPREKIWNASVPGHCVEISMILNISGGFNTITDYIILLLPVQAVSQLKITQRKRLLVILAFTFGLCAPVFATIGFVVRLRNSHNKDTTWKQPDILLWGAAELATGNLVVCFPEIAFMFRKRNRKSPSARHRPTPSELNRAWGERVIKKPSEPYSTTNLMNSVFATKVDRSYLELEDRGVNNVQIALTRASQRGEEPREGVILLRNDVRVTHQERFVV